MRSGPSSLPSFTELIVGATASFHAQVTSAGNTMEFGINGGGIQAIKRALGCAILTALPDSGIDEALQSLQDMWIYYNDENSFPLISRRETVSTTSGIVTHEVARLPLLFSGEE